MRRFQPVFAVFVMSLCVAASASAQAGRAAGTVRDVSGRAIRGALVRAQSTQTTRSEITSTTDDKGRFAMIGLTSGTWTFTAEAPGFLPQRADVPVRLAGTPPLNFTLGRDPGPIPNALDKNIAQEISEANALRDQGRLDQAIAAYQDLRTRNPTLTLLGLVLGDAYRRKAEQDTDPATRQKLFDQAIATYGEVLKSDATNARAQAELESTRAEASRAAGQTR
jgi:hypothetical protein